ncbi:MAG: DUF4255 domain-containing protein [Kofleriaceae bacterium]
MIGKTLDFVRRRLDAYLRAELTGGVDDPVADKVVFLEGDKLEPLGFKDESVSVLLINVEEERLLRAADRQVRVEADKRILRAQPELRLILHVLFVARCKQYAAAWDHLTKVIEYLQSHRILDRSDQRDLPSHLERLTFELMPQSFSEQSNIWSMLRVSYLPSALYRVGLVVLRDVRPVAADPVTQPITVHVRSVS